MLSTNHFVYKQINILAYILVHIISTSHPLYHRKKCLLCMFKVVLTLGNVPLIYDLSVSRHQLSLRVSKGECLLQGARMQRLPRFWLMTIRTLAFIFGFCITIPIIGNKFDFFLLFIKVELKVNALILILILIEIIFL